MSSRRTFRFITQLPLDGTPLVILTLALATATFIEVLDTTVANVAVPAISGAMGVSTGQGTWVISSYTMAAAIAVPLTGWLAGRIGEARLFLTSVLLFTLASTACALSTSMTSLVICRALQGFLSGPMVPLSQTLMLRAFPAERRAQAIALWGVTVLLAPIFGPVIGGWLVDDHSWHWIFLINLPIGLIAFATCFSLLPPDAGPRTTTPIDGIGIGLLVIGVGSLQAALDLGREHGWFDSMLITGLIVTAAITLGALLIWEAGERYPVVDLSVFRDRNYSFSLAIISVGMMGFALVGVIFPLWLQTVMGYSAFNAGLAMAPFGVLALGAAALVSKFGENVDPRAIASLGFIVFCGSLLWDAHFSLSMTFWQVATPGFILGIGLPCFFIPMVAVMLSHIPDDKLASATSLSNFLRTLAFAFGTAISVTLWDSRGNYHYGTLAQDVTPISAGTKVYLGSLKGIGIADGFRLHTIEQATQQQSYMLATNDMFFMTSMLCLALAGCVWLTRPKRGISLQIGH
ncbi:MAG: drug resistance transporter, drug:H+ antiporter-2 family protein [Verrucomicrobiaceae bacterium]|nr:drug resistance transporter, drug:H+ antiporter-2 family protein [Verrucomicrobiaceae bacterium]